MRSMLVAAFTLTMLCTAPAGASTGGSCSGTAPVKTTCSDGSYVATADIIHGVRPGMFFTGTISSYLLGTTPPTTEKISCDYLLGEKQGNCHGDPFNAFPVPGDTFTQQCYALPYMGIVPAVGDWSCFVTVN